MHQWWPQSKRKVYGNPAILFDHLSIAESTILAKKYIPAESTILYTRSLNILTLPVLSVKNGQIYSVKVIKGR